MKKLFQLVIILMLISSLLLSGCTDQGKETSTDLPNKENETDENPSNEVDKEKELQKQLEERLALEEQRKTELGEFYVPLPSIGETREAITIEAKGLFSTGGTAGFKVNKEDVEAYAEYIRALKEKNNTKIREAKAKINSVNKFEKILAIAQETEINALVIDVKDDDGLLTYESNLDIVKEVNGNRSTRIKDVKALLELLEEYDIYPIARIVCFKDKNLANNKPDHAIQLKTGGVWKDYSGTSWVNPFDDYVWKYNVAIAKEAALLGFKEIQFDYIRFPDNAKYYNPIVNFPGRNDRTKDEAIESYVKFAKEELKDYGVKLSADVFGVITKSWDDKPEDIGQTWRKMARSVDIMSAMVYPSHYGTGWYGFKVPDAHPYGVLLGANKESIERNASLKNPPQLRPWIQGFTASWVPGNINYGVKEIRDQIKAGKEVGVNEYIVWSASNNYDPLAYIPGADEESIITADKKDKNNDILARTPDVVAKSYLKAELYNINSRLYLLTPLNLRDKSYDTFKSEREKDKTLKLLRYEVKEFTVDGNNAEVVAYLKYKYSEEKDGETISHTFERENEKISLIKENGIWKVIKPEIDIKEVLSEIEQEKEEESKDN